MDPLSDDYPGFPALLTEIKKEPEESFLCSICTPIESFPNYKEKVLHDFFHHSEVTSAQEQHKSSQRKPEDPPKKKKKQTFTLPPYECDHCEFTSQQKMNIIKHLMNRHSSQSFSSVCLICDKRLNRPATARRHYVQVHGKLLNVSTVQELNMDDIKEKMHLLKDQTVYKKVTLDPGPVFENDGSESDSDDYYKSYHGQFQIKTTYHSSSDEYEEQPPKKPRLEHYECSICGKLLSHKNSLRVHMKTHEKKERAEDTSAVKMEIDDYSSDSD